MQDVSKTAAKEAVHWAIVLTAREGKVDELEEALVRLVQRSFQDRSATGVHLLRPEPDSGSREFLLHRSFPSKEHSRRFYESDLYRQYQRETDHLIEGDALIRPLHGFEAFFRGGRNPPPRWKMAIVTWLGVFPAVLLWSMLLAPRLHIFHPVAATAVITLLVVIPLTWGIMPRLTGALRFWLHGKEAEIYRRVPRH